MASTRPQSGKSVDAVALPTITPWLFNGFYKFCRYYLRKHFHAVAVDRRELIARPVDPSAALICYANHPGWWDPIIAIHLCQSCFPDFASRQVATPVSLTINSRPSTMIGVGWVGT